MSVPAERRRYTRHQIELRGWIGVADGRRIACVVRDYCSGGMLTQQPAQHGPGSATDLHAGQVVQLNTELLADTGVSPFRINAAVAWQRDDLLGLAFTKPSDAIVAALQRHDALCRGREPGVDAARSPGATRCLAKLRHVALGALPAVLREVLAGTVDDLLGRTDRVAPNQELQQIYVDINTLERQRDAEMLIESVVATALDDSVSGAEHAVGAGDELALVDTGDFERWLEASRVTSLLEKHYADRLVALGSRLNAIMATPLGATFGIPFEPKHFSQALEGVCKVLELGATSRAALFDRAASVLEARLGELYSLFDRTLDELGVPAAVDAKVTRLPNARPPAAAEPAKPGPTAAAGHPTAFASGAAGGVALDGAALEALLGEERELRTGLVGDMLSWFGDLPNMTDSLAGWLDRLSGPLLEQAATDGALFHDRRHPLRQIVDALGHLQLFRANPDLAPAEDPLYRRVSELLEPVGRESLDPETLQRIAAAVTELGVEQSRTYQRNSERVAEASEGRDRVRRARRGVGRELNRRYAGRRVPHLVVELLDVGWRALLELAWLNGGSDSKRYSGYLTLLDRVVVALGGDGFEAGREADPAGLLREIQGELGEAAFDPFRRDQVEALLRSALTETGHRPDLMVMQALDEGAEPPALEAMPAGIDREDWSRAVETCAAVNTGDHVRLRDAPPGRQDLRVAWVRDDDEAFTLVDHRGLKARDLSLREFAEGVHQRRILLRPSDGRPISDKALDVLLQRMEQRVAHQAAHDSLTGLINRHQFGSILEQALSLPGRTDDAGVLLMIDIDQFRLVNDLHGYDAGDRLLVAVARALDRLGGAKVLAHLSGDRFAVLLPDIAAGHAQRRAEELHALLVAMPLPWQGQALTLGFSIGAVGLTMALRHAGALLQSAEGALAAAKAAGGNRVWLYRADDPDIVRRQESVRWLAQVDEALECGQLRLRCQPIVPVRPTDGLHPHYEVLLGVTGGSSQALPIAEFIDAAERYNRMRAVDRWVTRATLQWIAQHRDLMPRLHGFAVNLSGQTASDPGFVEFVRDQFARTGVEPSWLSFEVTETAAVADLSASAGIVRELKALGCRVALDDFGSGLASYSYLKELPVDWLKIDGVFVRRIAANADDYAVVKSINDIGHFLGKRTIAEYVADEPILQRVRELGVDYAQGYRISPPLLMDELAGGHKGFG